MITHLLSVSFLELQLSVRFKSQFLIFFRKDTKTDFAFSYIREQGKTPLRPKPPPDKKPPPAKKNSGQNPPSCKNPSLAKTPLRQKAPSGKRKTILSTPLLFPSSPLPPLQ